MDGKRIPMRYAHSVSGITPDLTNVWGWDIIERADHGFGLQMKAGGILMRHYSFFANRACEYFPCHRDADPEDFNCLFCYCPLYVLGDRCGGDYIYRDNGRKDCTHCMFPHRRDSFKIWRDCRYYGAAGGPWAVDGRGLWVAFSNNV